MKMLPDEDDRDNLVLLAYVESVRLGERSAMPLLVNFMKLRAKENNHSFVGAKAGGKSKRDAWNHGTISIFKPMDEGAVLGDFLGSSGNDPFGMLLVKEYEKALTADEDGVATEMVAGYTQSEIVGRLDISVNKFRRIKEHVRRKAVEYLA